MHLPEESFQEKQESREIVPNKQALGLGFITVKPWTLYTATYATEL